MPGTSPSQLPDVLLVILHFGAAEMTHQCLLSLKNAGRADVLVVDNDPCTIFDIPASLGFPVRIVRTGGGMGFAEANNFGVRVAREKHHRLIYLVNNDIVFTRGSVEELKGTFDDAGVGVSGPAVFYIGAPRRLWAVGGRVFRLSVSIGGIQKTPEADQFDVDYIPAAALMTTATVWDEVGGLSEKYCFAFEEAEFALDAKKRGYRVVANTKSEVLHEVGASSSRVPMFYYNTVRNRIRFGQYLFGRRAGWLLGAFSALARSYSFQRQRVFYRGVADEIKGVPLTMATLARVKEHFGP